MNKPNPKVDAFLVRAKKWREEMEKLRSISLDCGLSKELKWGKPCYTFPASTGRQDSNVVIIQGFKEFCALLFCKGALLKDPAGILKKFGWQAARRVPFTNVREIVEMKPTLKAYIREAMKAEKAGLKITYKRNPEPIPDELQTQLDEVPALKKAFEALTPGRKRGYILYFSRAKQSKTREARVQKCKRQILSGNGLHD